MSLPQQNHPLNVEDEKFYKVILNELSNFEAVLKPQLHQILQRREKVNNLRASLASLCVPELIEFKETTEKQKQNTAKLTDGNSKIDNNIIILEQSCHNAKFKS